MPQFGTLYLVTLAIICFLIYLLIWKSERHREQQRMREIFHLLFHSPRWLQCLLLGQAKAGARNCIQVISPAGSQTLGTSSPASLSAWAGGPGPEMEQLGLELVLWNGILTLQMVVQSAMAQGKKKQTENKISFLPVSNNFECKQLNMG